jgi:hypothetical protein
LGKKISPTTFRRHFATFDSDGGGFVEGAAAGGFFRGADGCPASVGAGSAMSVSARCRSMHSEYASAAAAAAASLAFFSSAYGFRISFRGGMIGCTRYER